MNLHTLMFVVAIGGIVAVGIGFYEMGAASTFKQDCIAAGGVAVFNRGQDLCIKREALINVKKDKV